MRHRLVLLSCLAAAGLAVPASAASVSQPAGAAGCFGSDKGCAHGRAVANVVKAAVAPDGTSLYAVANDAQWGALLAFSRDAQTGRLTQLPGQTGCVSFDGRGTASNASKKVCAKDPLLARATDVAVSSDGMTVYTLGSDYFDAEAIRVWRRDAATGSLTAVQCLTALPVAGCDTGNFVEPQQFGLTADGRFLVIGGGSLSSVPVNADGKLGAGACYYRFARGTGGARTACAGKPVYTGKETISSLALAGTKVVAGVDSFNSPTGHGSGLAAFTLDPATGALAEGACAGSGPRTGVTCPAIRAFGYPFAMALSPDGDGVYTAGYDFVETDEEQGTGYVKGSAVSAYAGDLQQLAGTKGCVLFTGRVNKGCAKRPASHGKGFTVASGVAVTPSGASVLAGFRGAVTLLRRNATTQALTPIKGRAACVDQRPARKSGCRTGHGLGNPVAFAFSPDAHFAYALSGNGIATLRIAG